MAQTPIANRGKFVDGFDDFNGHSGIGGVLKRHMYVVSY